MNDYEIEEKKIQVKYDLKIRRLSNLSKLNNRRRFYRNYRRNRIIKRRPIGTGFYRRRQHDRIRSRVHKRRFDGRDRHDGMRERGKQYSKFSGRRRY